MNSPSRASSLINHETEPVIIPDMTDTLQIERNIFRKILFYTGIYEFLVISSSLGITVHYGGTSKCQLLFTFWIIACCVMWTINLCIQLLKFKYRNPIRINYEMLTKLNHAEHMINPYNLVVIILGQEDQIYFF